MHLPICLLTYLLLFTGSCVYTCPQFCEVPPISLPNSQSPTEYLRKGVYTPPPVAHSVRLPPFTGAAETSRCAAAAGSVSPGRSYPYSRLIGMWLGCAARGRSMHGTASDRGQPVGMTGQHPPEGLAMTPRVTRERASMIHRPSPPRPRSVTESVQPVRALAATAAEVPLPEGVQGRWPPRRTQSERAQAWRRGVGGARVLERSIDTPPSP